jgi:hypothetical protein
MDKTRKNKSTIMCGAVLGWCAIVCTVLPFTVIAIAALAAVFEWAGCCVPSQHP